MVQFATRWQFQRHVLPTTSGLIGFESCCVNELGVMQVEQKFLTGVVTPLGVVAWIIKLYVQVIWQRTRFIVIPRTGIWISSMFLV
jgi:hypothetical protein